MSIFNHNIYDNLRTRVIVTHRNHLLLLAPIESDDAWQLPGGGLQPNESLYECGEREVREETSIEISVTGIAFLREWIVSKYSDLREHNNTYGFGLEVYLYCKLLQQNPQLQPEKPDGKMPHWIPFEQVGLLPLWPKEIKSLVTVFKSGSQPRGASSFLAQLEDPNASAPDIDFM